MEKVELKNGEKIEIQAGATENLIKIEIASVDAFKDLYTKFSDDNLSQISILTETDAVCAIYKDKTLQKAELESVTDTKTEEIKLIVTITLKDINVTDKRLKSIEETVDTLVLNSLGVK
jgi:predicted transcriptional regulator